MLRLHTNPTSLADVSHECASVILPMGELGVFDCRWQQETHGTARLRNHIVFMSLTPQPRGIGIARDWLDGGFADVQGTGLFPAGQELRASFDGGAQRLLLYRLEPHRFDEVLGTPMNWDSDARLAAMDLRDPTIRQTLARIAQEALAPGPASQTLLEALSVGLIVDIGRHVGAAQQRRLHDTGGLAPWQMRRIEERVCDQPGVLPTLADTAALCGISTRQLVRAFKLTTGQTVHTWFAARQMDHARHLLTQTALPMKAIAAELGFRQPGSFTTAFHRLCGETPSAYRNRAARH